ncbi:hypothetical protein [Mycetohabitans rhizoxinica]|uniref:hypothetical protein n=1 Tax=Mycetohabitans rhizoxinica TaxID=412963 RepID=UPI0030CE767A
MFKTLSFTAYDKRATTPEGAMDACLSMTSKIVTVAKLMSTDQACMQDAKIMVM